MQHKVFKRPLVFGGGGGGGGVCGSFQFQACLDKIIYTVKPN